MSDYLKDENDLLDELTRLREENRLLERELAEREEAGLERIREELRANEKRLDLVLDATKTGIWEWDLPTNKCIWSKELWQLFGLEPHSCGPSYEAWMQTIHPEYREKAEQTVQDAVRHGGELNIEWYSNPSGGGERWLKSRGQPVVDSSGQIVRYIGVVIDVTERKKAQAAVKRTHERLAKGIQELKQKTENLEEVNTALRVLLRQREEDKKDLGETVLTNVRNLILPYLDKLKKSALSSSQMTLVEILESHINEITLSFSRTLGIEYANLTSTEIQVAALVRDGKSTTDIAEALCISAKTVCRHRDNIRHKLGLRGGRHNLRTYLLSLSL